MNERLPSTPGACRRDVAKLDVLGQEIERGEAQLQSVADMLPHLVWTTRPDGEAEHFNERWLEYTGARVEHRGWGWVDVVHPDEAPGLIARWNDCRQSGEDFEHEARIRRRDGVYRWHLHRARPQRDPQGRILRWIGTSTDIDERKRSFAQMEVFVDASPIGIVVFDRDLRYCRVNDALAAMNGIPREAHLGRTLEEIVPQLAPILRPILKSVLETGEPLFRQEISGETALSPGEERHWLVDYYPVRVGSELIGLAGLITEFTERKRTERTMELLAQASVILTASLEDCETTLQILTSLVVPRLGDCCGIYLREDAEVIRLVAVTHVDPSKVAVLRELGEYVSPLAGSSSGPIRVIRTGLPEIRADLSDEDYRRFAADAKHLELLRALGVRSSLVVPLIARGRIVGAFGCAFTRSRRRYGPGDVALVEELAHRAAVAVDNAKLFRLAQLEQRRAEEANRLKDEFLATMSHELRTPLNAILGWTRMLRTGALPDARRARALETIERNARAQAQLIEDLLDVSRITSGKLRLELGPALPAPMVQTALDAVRPVAEGKGVRLIVDLDPRAGPVMTDPDRLQQIVWNLLANAVKFTPSGGEVRTSLRGAGGSVEISVSDTGQGIRADFLPYVFEQFRQADASTTRAHGGLGLGLAIVYHLVELHGGAIQVVSEGEGRGATFRVSLPLAPAASAGQILMQRSPQGSALGPLSEDLRVLAGLRILVVDDEDDARVLVASALEQHEAEVETASSAAEALEMVKRARPDILLSDIAMPGEDGLSLMRKIRALSADEGGRIAAVAITACAGTEDRTQALRAGFDLHLPKPVEPAELLSVVASIAARLSA